MCNQRWKPHLSHLCHISQPPIPLRAPQVASGTKIRPPNHTPALQTLVWVSQHWQNPTLVMMVVTLKEITLSPEPTPKRDQQDSWDLWHSPRAATWCKISPLSLSGNSTEAPSPVSGDCVYYLGAGGVACSRISPACQGTDVKVLLLEKTHWGR